MEPNVPLTQLVERWQAKSVIVCGSHMYVEGGVFHKWNVRKGNHLWHPNRKKDGGVYWEEFVWQADMLPYKEMEKSVRGGAHVSLISCCYEAKGLDWHAWGWDVCKGPVWILWSVKSHTAERVGGKGEQQQEEQRRRARRGERKSDAGGGGGGGVGME